MRKVVAAAFTSLDGVMQAPGGPEEDPTGGFEHGGWTFHHWDAAMGEVMGEGFSKPFDPPSRARKISPIPPTEMGVSSV